MRLTDAELYREWMMVLREHNVRIETIGLVNREFDGKIMISDWHLDNVPKPYMGTGSIGEKFLRQIESIEAS